MSTATTETARETTWWTRTETARFLRLSENTVSVYVKDGRIPAGAVKRIGLKWLFNAAAIRAMVEA